tara:strand:- start:326 stop:673 length:348 start_codon:yes stop_codon:yes gene_type:complete
MKTDNLKLTYVFDIDGTLCTLSDGKYENATPIQERIDQVNSLYYDGHKIILNTARGMGRTENSPRWATRLFENLTKKQLEGWGVKYHHLFMGKPSGDIYIDDKGMRDEDFFNTRD